MPYNILLVDDNKSFRDEFADYLEGYNVLTTDRGKDALDILNKANEIDLVILDVMLPDMLGTKVLREIKKIAPDLGIIMLTGHSTKDIVIEALRGQADEYLEKPINIKTTKKIINNLITTKTMGVDLDTSSTKGKIERVKHFAQRNYNKKLSLNDVASAVCLSPKYLSKIFKIYTGKNFTDYRLEIKIEKSKDLLKNSHYNINQLAYNLGYQNTESFIRQFKKIVGCTPAQYKRQI